MKSTQAMRDRIRELMTAEQDDYDRAVECVLDDLEDVLRAKVSVDVDVHTDGDGHRVFGRVVDWQPEDYDGDGKGIGVRLLCEYESDNFDMLQGLALPSQKGDT